MVKEAKKERMIKKATALLSSKALVLASTGLEEYCVKSEFKGNQICCMNGWENGVGICQDDVHLVDCDLFVV